MPEIILKIDNRGELCRDLGWGDGCECLLDENEPYCCAFKTSIVKFKGIDNKQRFFRCQQCLDAEKNLKYYKESLGLI